MVKNFKKSIPIFLLALFSNTTGQSNILIKSILYIFLPISIFILIRYLKEITNLLVSDTILSVFFIFITMSLLWSNNSHSTIVEIVKIFVYSIFTFYLVINNCDRDLFSIFRSFFIISISISLIVCILFKSSDIFVHQDIYLYGNWKGIFQHKNALGSILAYAIPLFIIGINENRNKVDIVSLIISLICLYFSDSKTAVVAIFVVMGMILTGRLFTNIRKNNKYLMISIIFFVIIFITLVIPYIPKVYSGIVEILGKDENLSGRTYIYSTILPFVDDKFLIGYGLGGFWHTQMYSDAVFLSVKFLLTSAHSGILDTMLDLGGIGSLLIFIHILKNLRDAINIQKFSKYRIWYLTVIILIIIYNITDSRLFNTSGIYWIMYLSVSLTILKYKASNNVSEKNSKNILKQ